MIRAGTVDEISPESGEWLILDIGFSKNSPTCGFLENEKQPDVHHFSEAKKKICDFISKSKRPVNLMIEAPLSVAFNQKGNPTGRKIEKKNGKTRYWYCGPGCITMVAALYLVRAIVQIGASSEVRLFEGFVSFTKKGVRSNHLRDVKLLREVVEDRFAYHDAVIEANKLRMVDSDRLQSAFFVAGIDVGIPPIIMRNVEQ
ncbi:MAG: hypothetical protein C4527_01490 [Candidatus Omnitrophota bacterium]|jgi:hypothetical protein|nr:MAG: hypothetical protein C4527_01490 [Candidatus Omnitrophota bacterium]